MEEIFTVDLMEHEINIISRYSFEVNGLKILLQQFMEEIEFQISDEKYEEIFKEFLMANYSYLKYSALLSTKYNIHNYAYYRIDTLNRCIVYSNNKELVNVRLLFSNSSQLANMPNFKENKKITDFSYAF